MKSGSGSAHAQLLRAAPATTRRRTRRLPRPKFHPGSAQTAKRILSLSIRHAIHPDGAPAPIDVHLMTTPVDALATAFARAGADRVTFHVEASTHVDRTIQLIKAEGALAGLAFDPATPLGALEWVIDKVDLILVMSVNPGFPGQNFIPSTLQKLRAARDIIDRSQRDIRLEVDGGVKIANIRAVADAGADTIVSGSGIFGTPDYRRTIDAMRAELFRPARSETKIASAHAR